MTLRLNGSTSGYVEIDAPATAGSNTIVLPSGNGSANQLLKNGSTAGSLEFSSSVYIDSSQRLLVGTSSARGSFAGTGVTPQLQIEGTSYDGSTLSITRNVNSGGNGELIFGKSRGGSVGSNTVVADGDTLGAIRFDGADGTDMATGAYISAQVDGTPGSNDMPGRLVFSTTADGASSPTERFRINSNGTAKFETLNLLFGGATIPSVYRSGADGSGIHFSTNAILPTNETGTVSDNTEIFGNSGFRWSVIYAATGTINTSDINEKQDIQELSAAELAVAQELKTLFKTFRWKDAVAQKGDNARIHVGVIAQDVEQLFAKHGLDASRYALWCSDTWYEVDGKSIAEDGSVYTAETEGAVKKTRLGVRYDQLLAFVLAAL